MGTAATFAVVTAAAAHAEQQRARYDLQAQKLGDALKAVSRQSGRDIMFAADALAGMTSRPVSGSFTADEAVRALLEGTGLVADYQGTAILIRGRTGPSAEVTGATENQIVVTGSRIRGAITPSPVSVVTQQKMLDAGQSNLAEVIRSIPQNFGGGQNPGIGLNVPLANGNDISGATSFNLRGLGADATLTLLNGHRLAYGSSAQSIDLSTIPLAAVDRIEILADGASALYGSDAVAGVANIILKRDYSGFATTAQLGASTDGGYEQQHYNLLAGTRWSGGGAFITYDFARNSAIKSSQRAYAAARAPGLILYPAQRQHDVLASAHQALTDTLSLAADATFGRRYSTKSYAVSAAPNATRLYSPSWARIFSMAPRLDLQLPAEWKASLQGVHGTDKAKIESLSTASGTTTRTLQACLCNRSNSVELSGDGPLFAIGGDAAKLALGAGYRANRYASTYVPAASGPNIVETQEAYYAFGELNLPLVTPARARPGLYRLSLSGALRYEDYPGVDRVVTPKLGAIYAPSADLDLKATWGQSFKAPTLYQRYSSRFAILYTAASRGGVGYAPSATVIYQTGASADLKPERANTWTATLSAHPRALPGLKVEATYFHIRYTDRVVSPILYPTQALSALYADQVTLAPNDAAKAAALVDRAFFNNAGAPYNPANVVAIIRNNSVNAARQLIRGVDVSADYHFDLGNDQTLAIGANTSYLESDQRLTASQPELPLAGRLFNPPHWRMSANISWTSPTLMLSAFAHHSGGVEDARLTPSTDIGGLTSIDLTARLQLGAGAGPLGNTDITLSVRNVLNAKPDVIRTTAVFETPYDSTNYSPIGRFISLGVSKRW